jgi:hypothetical protein
LRLEGSRENPEIAGEELLPGRSNYFIGRDSAKWITGASQYSRVRLKGVYPGIDMVYYGKQKELEYDFIVAPGADPRLVQLSFEGGKKIGLDGKGNLDIELPGGKVVFQAPAAYQKAAEGRRVVASRFVRLGGGRIGFEVGGYDRGQPLFIDPVLEYSTYGGGSGNDVGYCVATDAGGNAYVTGFTDSPSFPTQSPIQASNN